MRKLLFVLVVAGSIAILMGGCTKSVEGSKYNYASGNLTAVLSANVEQSYDASLKALEELQLTPTEKAKDALGANITAKTSADKKISIALKRVNDMTTDITIGVGMTGDKHISADIYQKILANLKK